MKKKLNCVLLVDDERACNYFHKRLLNEMNCAETIEVATDGKQAIDFLKSKTNRPDIIFLDVNMPVMDGWQFLEEYEKLTEDERAKIVIAMVTSSLNPDDRARSETFKSVKTFNSKFLEENTIKEIIAENFPECVE